MLHVKKTIHIQTCFNLTVLVELLLSCVVLLQITVTSFNLLNANDIGMDLFGDKSNISPAGISGFTITLVVSDSFDLQPLIAVVVIVPW